MLYIVKVYGKLLLIASHQDGISLICRLDSDVSETHDGMPKKRVNSNHTGDGESFKTGAFHLGSQRYHGATKYGRFLFPLTIILAALLLASASSSYAQHATLSQGSGGQSLTLGREAIQLIVLLTLIALSPSLLAVLTCFTRVIIVLSLLRIAIGTPQIPPHSVIVGMALFITLFVMSPTFEEAKTRSFEPFMRGELSIFEAISEGYKPFQKFILRHTKEADIALFLRIANLPNPKRPEDIPAHVLIPAFVLSELRAAFEIGFLLTVPFLVIDFVVASVLMGMGMLMVPPMLISMPFKLLLFLLSDGWHMVMVGLALSVR